MPLVDPYENKKSELTDPYEDKPKEESTWSKIKRYAPTPAEVGRMALQGTGAMAGGFIGSGGGPVTSMAGGALGYAAGEKVADFLYNDRSIATPGAPLSKQAYEQVAQTGKDVGTGFIYELLGPLMNIGGKALYGAENIVKGLKNRGVKGSISDMADRFVKKSAANQIAGSMTKGGSAANQIATNERTSAQLEQNIQGLRFDLGERGGDPGLLSLTRTKGSVPGVGASAKAEADTAKNEAIRNYVKKNIVGTGEPGDFTSAVTSKANRLSGDVTQKGQELENLASKTATQDKQEIGKKIVKLAQEKRQASKEIADSLYAKVPDDMEIESKPLWDKVNELFGDYNNLTQFLNTTPVKPMSNIKTAMGTDVTGKVPIPETLADLRKAFDTGLLDSSGRVISSGSEKPVRNLTMKELRDFRSQVSTAQAAAEASTTSGSDVLAYKFKQLRNGINDSLNETIKKGGGSGVQALKEATDYYRDVHVPKFKQGSTLEVLRHKGTGEQRVTDSTIGKQYFKSGDGAMEAADNFLRTFESDDAARALIKDYAANILLRESRDKVTGEITTKGLKTFKYKYKDALKKFGLENEFSSIENASLMVDKAMENEAKFNNSAMVKALGTNPEAYIENALMVGTGKKQSTARLKEMADLARGEGAPAVDGLKTAIGNYFEKNVGTTLEDLAAGKMSSYHQIHKFWNSMKGALEGSGLYSKGEMDAWNNVHKALQVVSQKGKVSAKNSENFISKMASSTLAGAASIATGHIGSYSMAKTMYKAVGAEVEQKINEVVVKALYDPRYADELMRFVNNSGKVGVKNAVEKMADRVTNLNRLTGRGVGIATHPGAKSVSSDSGNALLEQNNPFNLNLPPLEGDE